MPHLIPMPRRLRQRRGFFLLNDAEDLSLPADIPSGLLEAAVTLADDIESVAKHRVRFARSEVTGKAIILAFDQEISGEEAYTLDITADAIRLSASQWPGLFYGIQTLRQLIRTQGVTIPCMAIADQPDFATRGFYHDCTRGKVPTLETLLNLVDKLSYYKINQLQLYIEHTFAFARHADIWCGADPLTAEEILRLDDACANRHIDLVPSISTFGHFYMALRSKRNESLNELDIKASERPFSFYERACHYTLNPSDPRSFKLVQEMLAEFIPLFRSRYVNICCDETFDLGKGKNASRVKKLGSTTKLYVQFLKKLITEVKRYGKSAMFWGDIIAKEPSLIRELPEDTIPLEWDYRPDVSRNDTGIMAGSGLKFYICPGVSGWNKFLNTIDAASQNIINYTKKGLKFKAAGVLNTDWGDYGHVNLLSGSYHGLALGAACGWNAKAASDIQAFNDAFTRIEIGDSSGDILQAWKEAGIAIAFSWGNMELLVDDGYPDREALLKKYRDTYDARRYRAIVKCHQECELRMLRAFQQAHPLDPLMPKEIICGLRGNLLCHLFIMALVGDKNTPPQEIADRLRTFEIEFSALWHRRNKPSEYYRVKQILLRAAERLDAVAQK